LGTERRAEQGPLRKYPSIPDKDSDDINRMHAGVT
jgi:hypothetical protein